MIVDQVFPDRYGMLIIKSKNVLISISFGIRYVDKIQRDMITRNTNESNLRDVENN